MSEHLDLYEPWTHTAVGLVALVQLDSMPRVLSQGAPTGLVPNMAQDEDAQPVARLSMLIRAGS